MKQWEIYLFPFRTEQPPPAVIISTDERCGNRDFTRVNALLCTFMRLNRDAKDYEVLLDQADGLDWKTAVRCDLIYQPRRDEFLHKRGLATPPRRVQITRTIIKSLRLPTS